MIETPTRPVLRYHGGKWRLAEWIIGFFPPHKVYVEPFGGAASVLLKKPRSWTEIYNDLDEDLVNLFRVLRDPVGAHYLIKAIRLTPFARTEFEEAYEVAASPIERARRLIVRAFMGFASTGACREYRTGFRAYSRNNNRPAPNDWMNYPDAMRAIVERLQGVCIERRPAVEVIQAQDDSDTLFYVDPPYVLDTRYDGADTSVYSYEMTDEQHQELLDCLRSVKGMVVLSGYQNPLYEEALTGWVRYDRETAASGGNKGAVMRTESIWLNSACIAAQSQKKLFA